MDVRIEEISTNVIEVHIETVNPDLLSLAIRAEEAAESAEDARDTAVQSAADANSNALSAKNQADRAEYYAELSKQVSSDLIPVIGTILPRGTDIPDWVIEIGKSNLYGGAGGSVFTNTGTTPGTIDVPEGFIRQAYYYKDSDTWIGGNSIEIPETILSTVLNPNSTNAAETGKSITDWFCDSEGTGIELHFNLSNDYLNASGVAVSSANWRTSEYVPVSGGDEIVYYGRTNTGGAARALATYDSGHQLIDVLLGVVDGTDGITVTIPYGAEYIRACTFNDRVLRLVLGGDRLFYIKEELLPPRSVNLYKSWVSIGTSITYMDGRNYPGTPSGVTGKCRGYQTWIRKKYKFTEFLNCGYSGASLGGSGTPIALRSNDWGVKDIYSLETITNDFKRNIEIGTIDDYNNNTGAITYYGALRVFRDAVYANNPNAIIIVANALRRNNDGYTSTSKNTLGYTLLDYDKALMSIAKLNDWYYIDQFNEGGVNDDNIGHTTLDGLHPNDFGYRLISKCWIELFDNMVFFEL